ncbi:hypothetical protein Hanom_Chr16g01519951 [Helianthus anomalus]
MRGILVFSHPRYFYHFLLIKQKERATPNNSLLPLVAQLGFRHSLVVHLKL